MTDRLTRRRALLGAATLPLVACGGAPPAGSSALGDRAAGPRDARRTTGDDVRRARAAFERLEERYDARLGVWLLDTGTGRTVGFRADRRIAFCSTIKALEAGVLLRRRGVAGLSERLPISADDVADAGFADVVRGALDAGRTSMTVRELCDAAVRYSDNAAANLLYPLVGGPAGLTRALRDLGDRVTRNARIEPALSDGTPGDLRDTTTPRQLATTLQTLVLGRALAPDERAVLRGWLVRNTTGDALIRAGVPRGWRVGDKTGTGGYGVRNDVAILWPPRRRPLVLAVMSTRPGSADAKPSDALVAAATRVAVRAL